MALTIPQTIRLYNAEGAARYGMEAVSQEQHALQCAWLAEQAGAGCELVAAALLHDLGHLLYLDEGNGEQKDDLHEYRALPFLRGEYPDAVIQPVRLHVAAKRYLCVVERGYLDALSPASKRSLQLQGGPFSDAELERFLGEPYAMDAVELRRWDDQAKDPKRVTPGWEHFGEVLKRACLRRERAFA